MKDVNDTKGSFERDRSSGRRGRDAAGRALRAVAAARAVGCVVAVVCAAGCARAASGSSRSAETGRAGDGSTAGPRAEPGPASFEDAVARTVAALDQGDDATLRGLFDVEGNLWSTSWGELAFRSRPDPAVVARVAARVRSPADREAVTASVVGGAVRAWRDGGCTAHAAESARATSPGLGHTPVGEDERWVASVRGVEVVLVTCARRPAHDPILGGDAALTFVDYGGTRGVRWVGLHGEGWSAPEAAGYGMQMPFGVLTLLDAWRAR